MSSEFGGALDEWLLRDNPYEYEDDEDLYNDGFREPDPDDWDDGW